MIKIQRIPAPRELTPLVVAEKTALFKSDSSKVVWKERYIESSLLEMSHDKCCYCECKLGIESQYMEVEHFHNKYDYPDEVVEWNNLLPSCRACNGSKGSHDTIAAPIVNPTIDDPKDHLGFKDFRYKWKTGIGKETVTLLHLNDTEKRCKPRFCVCAKLSEKVESFLEGIQSISAISRTQEKNRMRNKVRELLEACQCDSEYTAIKATTMVHNSDYDALVREMKLRGLWTPDLVALDSKMRGYVLDVL